MEVAVDKKPDETQQFFRRRSVRVLMLVLLLVVFCRVALPFGLKIFLEKWFVAHGADSASIGQIHFKLLSGEASLHGVSIVQNGKVVFEDSSILVDLGLKGLAHKKTIFEQVILEDVVLDMETYPDGSFRIASLTLSPGEETSEESADQEKRQTSWLFFGQDIQIRNSRVSYCLGDFFVDLQIKKAVLSHFDTDPENAAGSFFLEGKLNDAPIILDFPKIDAGPIFQMEGAVDVAGFQLDELQALLREVLDPFTGSGSIAGNLKITWDETAGFDIAWVGDLTVRDCNIAGANWDTGGTLIHDGQIAYHLETGRQLVVVAGDLELDAATFAMPQIGLAVKTDDAQLAGKTKIEIAADGVVVENTIEVQMAPSTLVDDELRLALGASSWAGKVTYQSQAQQQEAGTQHLVVSGDLQLGTVKFAMQHVDLAVETASAKLSGKTSCYLGNGGFSMENAVDLALAPLTLMQAGSRVSLGTSSWAGMVHQDLDENTFHLDAVGKLETSFLDVAAKAAGGVLQAKSQKISWDGMVDCGLENGAKKGAKLQTDGVLTVQDSSCDLEQVFETAQKKIVVRGKSALQFSDEFSLNHNGQVQVTEVATNFGDTVTQPGSFTGGNVAGGTVDWKGNVAGGTVDWKGNVAVRTTKSSQGVAVDTDGALSLAGVSWDMDGSPQKVRGTSKEINWAGKLGYGKDMPSSQRDVVRFDGVFNAEETSFTLAEQLALHQGHLVLRGQGALSFGAGLFVDHNGELSLENTALTIGKTRIREGKMHWKGGLQYTANQPRKGLNLDGVLDLDSFAYDFLDQELTLQQNLLRFAPRIKLVWGDTFSLDGGGDVSGGNFSLLHQEVPLVTVAAFSAANFRGEGSNGLLLNSFEAENIQFHTSDSVPLGGNIPMLTLEKIHSPNLTAATIERAILTTPQFWDLAREDVNATIEKIVLDKLDYAPRKGLVCDAVTLDSLSGVFVRRPQQKKDTSKETKKRQHQPIPLRINSIDMNGENKIEFTDTTLAREFKANFLIDAFTIRNLDLNQVEQPFSYMLKGSFDKYSPVEVSGTMAPLAKDVRVKQKLVATDLSMLQGSSYTVEAIGSYFTSGSCDITSTLDIHDGTIDMENTLVFDKLRAEKVSGEFTSKLDGSLPVPLGMAIKLMEDNDGTIKIKVPIKGDLATAKLDFSNLFWSSFTKALTMSLAPYLAYTALGPAGALTYFGAQLGRSLIKTRFPVLQFAKGTKELTEEHKALLDKIGEKIEKQLKKKDDDAKLPPLLICAKVSMSELQSANEESVNQDILENEALRNELYLLGEARSVAVQKYLLEKFDITKENLQITNPGLEFNAGATPVVEFRQ